MSRTEAGLQSIISEIAGLLERHRVLDDLAHRQDTPNRAIVEELQHRQNLVELQRQIRWLHPSDLAHVLESLPLAQRLQVWREADARQAAEALVELDPVVGHALIAATDRRRLKAVVGELDLDDLAYLSDAVPDDTFREVLRSLGDADQSLLQQTIAYPEESVGQLMTREVAAVRDTQTIGHAIAEIRHRGSLPPHSDRLFVVDARNILRGSVVLQALLFADPSATIATVMEPDPVSFSPEGGANSLLRSLTLSQTKDNGAGSLENANGNSPAPQNFYDIDGDFGLSGYHQPYNSTTSFVWSLPIDRGKRWGGGMSGALDALAGGWQLAGINTVFPGEPVTFRYDPAASFQVSGIAQDFRGANSYRPNVIGDPYAPEVNRRSPTGSTALTSSSRPTPASRSATRSATWCADRTSGRWISQPASRSRSPGALGSKCASKPSTCSTARTFAHRRATAATRALARSPRPSIPGRCSSASSCCGDMG